LVVQSGETGVPNIVHVIILIKVTSNPICNLYFQYFLETS